MQIDKSDYIDLKEILDILVSEWRFLFLSTVLSAIVSVLYALSLTNYYKSEAIFSVAGQDDMPNISGQLGPLASIAGIDLGTSGPQDKSALTIQTIKSRSFLERLIKKEEVLPSLMASESFDAETKKLVYKKNIYDVETGTWVRKVSYPFKPKPSVIETHTVYLSEILNINQDKKTGFISISIEHISPIFAQQFLELIYKEINLLMRQKDLEEATDSLAYLQTEIATNKVSEMKVPISQLMLKNLQTQMLTKVREDYVLRVIDPPYIPELKSKPSRAIICIFGTFLGTILSSIFILFSHYYEVNLFRSNSIGKKINNLLFSWIEK